MPEFAKSCKVSNEAWEARVGSPGGHSHISVSIPHLRPVIWCSLVPASTPAAELQQSRKAPRFPILVDTGYNGGLLMNPKHVDWTGFETKHFRPNGRKLGLQRPHQNDQKKEGKIPEVEVRIGRLFVHPNVVGSNVDMRTDVNPLEIELYPGIVIYDEKHRKVDIPVLGLWALRKNDITLTFEPINNENYSFSMISRDDETR